MKPHAMPSPVLHEARAMPSPVKTTSELDDYLRLTVTPRGSIPTVLLGNQSARFSGLVKMAVKYLAIHASSAPVERLFSVAGKMFRPDRRSLSDKHFEDIMLIRCNAHSKPWAMSDFDADALHW